MSSIIARRRHPAAGYAAVAGGLVVAGVLYSTLSGGGASAAAPALASTQVEQGKSLFIASCSSCHGLDAQGTTQAPSLIGAGAAAVYFQMSTGRMPAKELGAENDRKPTDFSQQDIYDIAAYVASLGGGPAIPTPEQVDPAGGNTALGEELFSTNCAQCHGFAGAGGALTYGKNAPPLTASTPTQIYTAMLTGPEAMPVFGDGTVTPAREARHHRIHHRHAERAQPRRAVPRPQRHGHRRTPGLARRARLPRAHRHVADRQAARPRQG